MAPITRIVSKYVSKSSSALLKIVATFRCKVIVTGDFNIHFNEPADRHAVRLAELLSSLDLHQAEITIWGSPFSQNAPLS